MFSGGLDSTLLARILSTLLPAATALDLINVSFAPDSSADRFTALFSYAELIELCPDKEINLLCADYDLNDVDEDYIMSLVAPKQSHMDFNIGCALHFASKGEGYLVDKKFFDSQEFRDLKELVDEKPEGKENGSYDFGLITNKIKRIEPGLYRTEQWVKSPTKVVFSGLGADEVWAGYSRYKTASKKDGVEGL